MSAMQRLASIITHQRLDSMKEGETIGEFELKHIILERPEWRIKAIIYHKEESKPLVTSKDMPSYFFLQWLDETKRTYGMASVESAHCKIVLVERTEGPDPIGTVSIA